MEVDDTPEPPALRRALQPGVLSDMRDGRMGCQAALLELPGRGGRWPLVDTLCAVVGGVYLHTKKPS